jgi:signal transduction histidine kinase
VALRRALANLIDNAVKYGREAEVGLQATRSSSSVRRSAGTLPAIAATVATRPTKRG